MGRYRFDEQTRAAYEKSVVPIGIYQMVDGHVMTLIASDGLCELFGYKDRAEAAEKMDSDMYWNIHPDDVKRVMEAAAGFIQEDKPYNLVCRVMREDGYRIIHARGKHIVTEAGERLAVVWYIDEGSVVLDAKMEEDKEKTEGLKASMMSMDIMEVMRIRKENERTNAAYQEALNTKAIYESMIDALSEDYFNLFYVNVESGNYIEYGSRMEKGRRTTEKTGTDFFGESRKNAPHYIYKEDLTDFIDAVNKERLVGEIRKHGVFIFNYRLLINGSPTYVIMKATQITGDDRHIIIGVSNVDSQIKDRLAAERAVEERKTYLRLSALNGNLIVLYFIDLENDQFTEFSSSEGYKNLGIARQGTDFFKTAYENSLWTVHPEDQSLFHSQITKDNILSTIDRDGVFALAYRMMSGNLPTYVRLKAAKVEEDGKTILIIGLMNEDAQIRQEQEYARSLSAARNMATVDSLTGVKNKHAYVQWEETINEGIRNGTQEPFAVVVCDINNLKIVNDQYGHKEGDICIQKACVKICSIFSHSPVFRVGGDEFVVFLTGVDFCQRKELMTQISVIPKDPSKIRIGETISAGMAEYRKNQHASLLDVFEEADKAMYERKQLLKAMDLSKNSQSVGNTEPEEMPVIHVRKTILIADDIETNREIMHDLLQEEYDILYASDGTEALEVLRSHKDEIDLVLLDLQMPNKNGRDVIAEMQIDEDLMSIPVVFLTVDQKAELDCLKSGAMDFIPKPYPDIEIVKARIAKCIELSENRELIRYTERDKLTGLLNKDYFYRYVGRLDHLYKNTVFDAIACDVNRFHSANKQYGRQFCDQVLRSIASGIKKMAHETGGICCREAGDTFLLYCLHQDDYEQRFRDFLTCVFADTEMAGKISMRFGVFTDALQETDVEERFACAKIAGDRVKDDPQRVFEFY